LEASEPGVAGGGAPAASVLGERGADWLRTMVRIRLFEETLADLHRRGELVGVVHLSVGQEATAVGVCSSLRAGDQITSTHRGHHHMLARGLEPRRMYAEILGRAGGYCGGKGGSMHVSAPAEGAVGANGIVGGGIPHAVGLAFAAKALASGAVAVAFFGDGAANQGVFFESLNLAALWQAPVLFVCENNGYTEFTPTDAVTAGESIAARAAVFGIPSTPVDGDDVGAVHRAAAQAVERARGGGGPAFLECRTTRWRGHHEGEESYARPYRELVEPADPIERLVRALAEAGLEGAALRASLEAEERARIEEALAAAQAEPAPPEERALEDVFA
jgi:TPP-dependent pyruvate/acetoin dehydrogenase alpha subunit